ncbi:MAG: hypothetical protein GF317_12875 [Candidatus Lokiarchaeota archaeon]|nr:hypothetical protein [Candidatus Lokiarchaeota archaeon]MBD3200534.1 hypothetical protein [Candidatus Lokiarchaeota archaeon]
MIISITHEVDLDGLGSQAIIKRYFEKVKYIEPQKIRLYFAQYTNFKEKVKSVLNREELPEKLIISDLGFNDDFNELFPLFKKAQIMDCKIFWFDHHIVDSKIRLKLKQLLSVYLNNKKKCAAEIVKDYFLPEDPIANEIAEYARDSDFGTNKYKISEELQSVIAFNRGIKKLSNRKHIVNFLSVGNFLDVWFDQQLESLKIWEEREIQKVTRNIKIYGIENLGEIIISFAKIGGGKIAKWLKQHYPEKKLYLGIDSRYNEVIIYSDYVDCRELARQYHGGGHRNRAGFKISTLINKRNEIDKKFLEDFVLKILKYVD